jgi:hypothetical protein
MAERSITNEAVEKATGKNWEQWMKELDALKASELPHKQIAQMVNEKFGAGAWWSQMVTVEYERHKGLRVLNQKADGFEVSVTKVFPDPLEAVYGLFASYRWLTKPLKPRTANPNKSLRADGPGGVGVISINFYPKGEAKTQVSLQHSKLPSAEEVEKYRRYWRAAFEKALTMAF